MSNKSVVLKQKICLKIPYIGKDNMTKILKLLFIAYILLSTGFCVVGQSVWHYPLYLDGNYPYAKRVEITFENKTTNELDGEIFRIPAKKLGIKISPMSSTYAMPWLMTSVMACDMTSGVTSISYARDSLEPLNVPSIDILG